MFTKSVILVAFFLSSSVFAETIQCKTNLDSGDGQSALMNIAVDTEALTTEYRVTVDTSTRAFHDTVRRSDYNIRPNLDFTNLDAIGDSNLNEGERRLVHAVVMTRELTALARAENVQYNASLNFDAKDVTRIIVWDLDSSSRDGKFGGFTLVEAFKGEQLLGRFVSAILVNSCQP